MVAARRLNYGRIFWFAYAAGFVHCLLAYYWIAIVTVPGWLLMPIYLALYWPAFFLVVEFANRRLAVPRVVSAIALWPLLELLRGWAFTGLPWFYLGHALYRWPRLIQSADLGGVLLVSAVVVAVNALLAEVIAPAKTWRVRAAAAVVAAALFAGNLAYGVWRLPTVDLRPGPTVALVQPNVPQSLKIDQQPRDSAAIFLELRAYSLSARARSADLIVWPETITPGFVGITDYTICNGMTLDQVFDEMASGNVLTPDKRATVSRLVNAGMDELSAIEYACGVEAEDYFQTYSLLAATPRIAGKPLIAGALAVLELDSEGRLIAKTGNRACYFDAEGRQVAVYDKVHLVPFGEFIPLRTMWPAASRVIGKMMPVQSATWQGDGHRVFDVAGFRWGPAICFEDAFSYIGRIYRRKGADILLNLTNDGWFGGSFELEAHLANSVFRAVETRMAVVRSANTGVSAVISPRGEVVARLTDKDGRDREVEGCLVAEVPVSGRRAAYLTVGEGWLFAPAAFAVLWALGRLRRRVG
jgi:apolipoprotein N-acyltransferase